jgi:7-alpha-hydroxysteroid dehydrogenase
MSFSISGKTAIVTGAANGIGLAIGRHLADKGANVMFADMNEADLIDQLGEDAEDGPIRFFAGDLREKLTLANLLSATIDAFDSVDILVNASRQVAVSDPLNPDDDAVGLLIEQNLMTALRLSQLVAKRMIKQSEAAESPAGGAIINLSSITAGRAHPDLLAYAISAAAIDQMTRSLAITLAPHRIRVNALAFGSVMSRSLQETLKEHDDHRADIERHTPLGRIAASGDLAEAVQFLASDAASFMTGQIVTLDGGRSLVDPVTSPAH